MANLTVYLLKVSNSRRADRNLRYPGKLRSTPRPRLLFVVLPHTLAHYTSSVASQVVVEDVGPVCGGKDRHFCIGVRHLAPLLAVGTRPTLPATSSTGILNPRWHPMTWQAVSGGPWRAALEREGVAFTASKSGRPAIFFRDPDCNTLEVVEGLQWR